MGWGCGIVWDFFVGLVWGMGLWERSVGYVCWIDVGWICGTGIYDMGLLYGIGLWD